MKKENDNVKDVDFTEAHMSEEEEQAVKGQFAKAVGMTDEEAKALIEKEIAKKKEAGTDEKPKEEPDVNWMSFVIGLRSDAVYECKTNVKDTMLTDFIEALAGIEMNVIVNILKTNNIESVKTFQKMKELLMLNSVRMIGENFEQAGLTAEQYDQLRLHFNVDKIEAMLEQRKNDMANPAEAEKPEEEPFKIEVE